MSRKEAFLEHASRLFETARNCAAAGSPNEFTILIGHDGSIRVMADSDWPLESAECEFGARMAFRIRQAADGRVRLEGREGSRTCLLEAPAPESRARMLLATPVCYEVSASERLALPAANVTPMLPPAYLCS